MNRIEVICRRCGRKAPADEFKVDHIYKLAVCKVCYTDRKKDIPKKVEEKTSREQITPQELKTPENKYEIRKSKILDEDDEYLERAVEKKKQEILRQKEDTVKVKNLQDNKVLYPCQHCTYKFKYNIQTQRPTKCPYCAKNINHRISF